MALCWALQGYARAQTGAQWLWVSGKTGRCLREAALAARTRAYLQGDAPAGGVSIEVYVDRRPVEFAVIRQGEVVARRVFDRLPRGCRARRNALGLSLALAIESVGAGVVAAGRAGRGAGGDGDPARAAWQGNPLQTARPTADAVPARQRAAPPGPGPVLAPRRRSAAAPSVEEATGTAPVEAASDRREMQRADRSSRAAAAATASASVSAPEEPGTRSQATGGVASAGDETVAAAMPLTRGAPAESPSNSRPSRARPPGPAWSVVAGAGLALEVEPEPALVWLAGAELNLGLWSFGLSGLWSPEVQGDGPAAWDGKVRTGLYGARASGCLGTALGPVRAEGCVGLLGGLIHATGEDFAQDRETTVAWLATAVGASARFPERSPLSVRLRVDGHQNVVQPEWVVTGADSARVRVLGLSAFVELQWTPR